MKSPLSFIKFAQVPLSVVKLALADKIGHNALDITSVLLDELERSLEADVGDAFVVVATGENTSPQQHLVREFCVVRHLVFLALLKPVQVNEQAVALDVHLCEDLRHAVRKQIRILGDDEVDDARLEKEGKLSVALVRTDDVLDVLHSELLDEVVDHLTADG